MRPEKRIRKGGRREEEERGYLDVVGGVAEDADLVGAVDDVAAELRRNDRVIGEIALHMIYK